MTPPTARDLGSGVRLATLADGSLLVRSERLPLPWTARRGRAAGTAVMVDEEAYEAVAGTRAGGTESWTLTPWSENEAMRVVVTLDAEWVRARAVERQAERRATRLRLGLLPVAPLLGFAPTSLQSAWERGWGFPSMAATVVSALAELGVAAVGMIHVLAGAFGGAGVLPRGLAWIGLLAPALAIEAMVRLKHVMAVREPIGTALLLPLSVLLSKKRVAETPVTPVVRRFDHDSGTLELWSPVHRSDWDGGGDLSYRDERYSLRSVDREGRGWIYVFEATDRAANQPALRLRPHLGRASPPPREQPAAVMRTALVTAAACFAPRDLQETWSVRIDIPAVLLTVLGAGAECCGSLLNLTAARAATSPASLLVNTALLAEGSVRLVLLVTSGRPVGSLAGVAFRQLLERIIEGRGVRSRG